MDSDKLVKIKTWEQMEKEFGLNDRENINLPNNSSFGPIIEALLPKNRIIKVKTTSEGFLWFTNYGLCGIHKEAIEKILSPEEYPQYFI